MPPPFRIAFLGCGFITRVHSGHLRALGGAVVASYASRDRAKAEAYCRRFGGAKAFPEYAAAIADPAIDGVVIAVPPRHHRELALAALDAGKHVLVEKPAFPRLEDYDAVREARDRAGRTVLVGENDHYKPLVTRLRALLAAGTIGDVIFVQIVSVAERLKTAGDWRNDEAMAGGDAFFEEGIHWLHIAGALGPTIVSARGFRPVVARRGPDLRAKSMLVALRYDTGAVGSVLYSREVPSLLRGLRFSKLYGTDGVITFESNGALVVARGRGLPRLSSPGLRDIRGYQAMYRDFVGAARQGRPPEMSLERAMQDHRLMEQVFATADAAER